MISGQLYSNKNLNKIDFSFLLLIYFIPLNRGRNEEGNILKQIKVQQHAVQQFNILLLLLLYTG